MDNPKEDVKVEEVPLEQSSVQEKPTEEVKVPEAEVATEAEGAQTETVESGKSANQRIRELVREKKEAVERAQSLADRLAEITAPSGALEETPAFKPQIEPGQEISPEQYQADVVKSADAIVELKIKQNNAINRINNESNDVVKKYPQLDPDSEQFDPELSEAITEATEAFVRNSPYSASVTKFVDKMMKPYQGSVAKEVGKVTENITKQVSETALRPSNVKVAEKKWADKSIEEMEAELPIHY